MIRALRLLAPHLPRTLAAMLATCLAELAALGLMTVAAWLIARAAEQPPLAALTLGVVAVRALAIGRGGFRYLDRLLGHNAALAAVAHLRSRVFTALVPLPQVEVRRGRVLTQLLDDVETMQELLLRGVLPATAALGVGTCAIVLTLIIHPAAGLLLGLGLLLAGLVVPAALLLLDGRTGKRMATAQGELSTAAIDLTEGAADLAAYGAQAWALRGAEKAAADLARAERRKALATSIASASLLLLQGLTTTGIAVLALRAVATGQLSPVLVPVLALAAFTVFEAFTPLPAAARWFDDGAAAAQRLASVLNAPASVAEPRTPEPITSAAPVRLRGVRARYRAAEPLAVDGVDLDLEPGRRCALVGASGAGKSTLLAVLTRTLDYTGSVRLGGVELRDCAGDDVRRHVTGIFQDAHVFHATLRENLLLASPAAGEADLTAVLGRVRLGDWMSSLPDGLDTLLAGDGVTVSGGQRQRLLLARALLADPDILVADEPTEGLDPQTAAEVLPDLLDATRGRAVLLVTHHLEVLGTVDEIVVLDGGRVVDRGPHAELAARPGPYRDLLDAEAFQRHSTGA